MNRYDPEALRSRAAALTEPGATLNGVKLVFVSLAPAAAPTHAWLEVKFYNDNGLADILQAIQNHTLTPTDIFRLSGGSRIPAGIGSDQVRVIEVADGGAPRTMRLRVQPIGDYSSYTLHVVYGDPTDPLFDPVFDSVEFKFRPGCFNLNCAPTWERAAAAPVEPVIDYLAKDFDSFKHLLISAMMERVPNWTPTSEADLDQVLIDLIAADADELSDYQDRVMNEAYLGRARKRVSLARHARLMDYHIHQGNQASTWIALKVTNSLTLPENFGVWTGRQWDDAGTVIFITNQTRLCDPLLNELQLYTWDGLVTALETGSTEADLALPASLDASAEADADQLRDLLRNNVDYLLLEVKLNPETGAVNGRDTTARQLLRLLDGNAAADSMYDPLAKKWFVRVRWRTQDQLTRRYCFITVCEGQKIEGVSAFHGNLAQATHGRPHQTIFRSPGAPLASADGSAFLYKEERSYEPTPWGVLCRLPHSPLAYRNTLPGGEHPVRSTVKVFVNGSAQPWEEQSDLIESKSDARHFIVETDEHGVSAIRFGNNINGLALPAEAEATCWYQVGRGSAGNVGADTLTSFDGSFAAIQAIWNPFDVTDGRDPEKPEVIIRRAPEAYRARQLRAVTLDDYVKRAEELPDVSHAYASYAWTGSWRTVRVAIDPAGATLLSDEVRRRVESHLDAVRLIGEDLEVRGARYVALDIMLSVCADPEFWPEDLTSVLEMEFSDGYTSDGRPGFFHPDLWTFGRPLHASQLIGRALSITGVERVRTVSMRRWNAGFGPSPMTIIVNPEDLPEAVVLTIAVEPYEIIQVANDPNYLEHGRIQFDIRGGRQ